MRKPPKPPTNPIHTRSLAFKGSGTSRAVVEEEGPALTHAPLVVLVNDQSASASEILSGALKDNARALIVGDKPTYGKGRIQSVFELEDGSALFVTVGLSWQLDGTGCVGVRSCQKVHVCCEYLSCVCLAASVVGRGPLLLLTSGHGLVCNPV